MHFYLFRLLSSAASEYRNDTAQENIVVVESTDKRAWRAANATLGGVEIAPGIVRGGCGRILTLAARFSGLAEFVAYINGINNTMSDGHTVYSEKYGRNVIIVNPQSNTRKGCAGYDVLVYLDGKVDHVDPSDLSAVPLPVVKPGKPGLQFTF